MRTLCVILSFIILTFLNDIELIGSHKDDAVHPLPIILNLTNFGGYVPTRDGGRAGLWYAGAHYHRGGLYIFGVMIGEYLYPIRTATAYRYANLGKVKVRIDGNVADVAVPILGNDPLNYLFYNRFGPENVTRVWIPN